MGREALQQAIKEERKAKTRLGGGDHTQGKLFSAVA
jgi:hypothetical protein